MREKLKTLLIICLLLMLLPYMITYALQGENLFLTRGQDTQNMNPAQTNEPIEIFSGILAGQISMDAPMEAICAQAVLVRTDYYYREQAGETLPQPLSMDELAELWGSDRLQQFYAIAQQAVVKTAGEVLTYDGKPIQAAYHAVSAGRTRASGELNGVQTPYLGSVACEKDILSEDYLTVVMLTAQELAEDLQLEESAELTAVVTSADDAGYVQEVQVGGHTFSGDEFRRLLGLPSPCFTTKEVDDRLRIVVRGSGHGIGLSQYAACMQAESGADYREILNYFFSGAELEKI